jgi:hypothetical protein
MHNCAITSLTGYGIKTICETDNPVVNLRDQFFILQVTEVKLFTSLENKKNIKAR